jgi:hypothetical protein
MHCWFYVVTCIWKTQETMKKVELSRKLPEQRGLNVLQKPKLSCGRMIRHHAPPSLPSVSWTGDTQEDGKRDIFVTGERRRVGGRGDESYDGHL